MTASELAALHRKIELLEGQVNALTLLCQTLGTCVLTPAQRIVALRMAQAAIVLAELEGDRLSGADSVLRGVFPDQLLK